MNPRTAAAVPLALLTLATVACESPAGPGAEPAPEEITELPRALSVSEARTIEATNEFGLELLRRLHADPGRAAPNVFLSPLSAAAALGMALAGAAGDTYDGMVDALALEGLSEEEIYRSYQDLVDLLLGLDPSVELEIANVAWLSSTYSFLPEYRARVQEAFDARLESFTPGDAEAVEQMNRWVAEVTRGYITELLQPGDIRPSTIAALLNAVYFEADWRTRFDPARTAPAPFQRPDGSVVTVPLMHLSQADVAFGYAPEGDAQVAELAYGGGAFAMTLVVPVEGTSLVDVVARADPEWWSAVTGTLHDARGEIWLPRFEVEYQALLNGVLSDMGMGVAFGGGADFSRMGGSLGPYIEFVRQKSFVSVDEEGTVATAATAVVIDESAGPALRADRPFLFAIRERLSGTILFLGTVEDPTAG